SIRVEREQAIADDRERTREARTGENLGRTHATVARPDRRIGTGLTGPFAAAIVDTAVRSTLGAGQRRRRWIVTDPEQRAARRARDAHNRSDGPRPPHEDEDPCTRIRLSIALLLEERAALRVRELAGQDHDEVHQRPDPAAAHREELGDAAARLADVEAV